MTTIAQLKRIMANDNVCTDSMRFIEGFNPEADVRTAFDVLRYGDRWWLSDIGAMLGETDEDGNEAYDAVNQFSLSVNDAYDRISFSNADGSTMTAVERYTLWKPIRERMWSEFKLQYWEQFSARWLAQIEKLSA